MKVHSTGKRLIESLVFLCVGLALVFYFLFTCDIWYIIHNELILTIIFIIKIKNLIKQQREIIYRISRNLAPAAMHMCVVLQGTKAKLKQKVTGLVFRRFANSCIYHADGFVDLNSDPKCWKSIFKIHMHALVPCKGCCTNCCTLIEDLIASIICIRWYWSYGTGFYSLFITPTCHYTLCIYKDFLQHVSLIVSVILFFIFLKKENTDLLLYIYYWFL